MSSQNRVAASFRDPSGFLFRRDGVLYRQVNQAYADNYRKLMDSGLYQELVDAGLLVAHREVDIPAEAPAYSFCILQPELVPFISYPYEWSFAEYKAAALATLEVQQRAFAKGMALKDASAYNIQFLHGKPVLIDTLSFEIYREGEPWVAYRQFCQHFLAPLALMVHTDVRLSQLMRVYIDGIPLDLAAELLPGNTKFNIGLASHIHLHAGAQKHYADKTVAKETVKAKMSQTSFLGLMDSLKSTVEGLKIKPPETEWAHYYDATNYTGDALKEKFNLVKSFVEQIKPATVWDLGANTGFFSRAASDQGIFTVAMDIDPAAVDEAWRIVVEKKEKSLLPLVMDLTNPSPALGWNNTERMSFSDRGNADCVMALALIHHLAISNNVPLLQLADFFAGLSRWLIIEFVPKEDSQVQRLLATREDIFPDYNPAGFEAAFGQVYTIVRSEGIPGSRRTLYLLERKGNAG
jgi:hypothetical protein